MIQQARPMLLMFVASLSDRGSMVIQLPLGSTSERRVFGPGLEFGEGLGQSHADR